MWLGQRRGVLLTSVWIAAAYFMVAGGVGTPVLAIAACFMTGIARGGNSIFSSTMISPVGCVNGMAQKLPSQNRHLARQSILAGLCYVN